MYFSISQDAVTGASNSAQLISVPILWSNKMWKQHISNVQYGLTIIYHVCIDSRYTLCGWIHDKWRLLKSICNIIFIMARMWAMPLDWIGNIRYSILRMIYNKGMYALHVSGPLAKLLYIILNLKMTHNIGC